MTEKEAAKYLRALTFNIARRKLPRDTETINTALEAVVMGMKALEEIQQYRAFGTVEQIEEQMLLAAADETILSEYKELGFVEELREAKEKRIPKIPYIWGDGYSDGHPVYDMYDCPNCGESYEIDGEKYNFCPNCGQAIDWRWEKNETD